MQERTFFGLLFTLAVFGFVTDQASKYSVFGWLATVESNTYALFQTEPESRFFAVVPAPADPMARFAQRGFFLEVAFQPQSDPNAPLVPHVNHGALFGLGREHTGLANLAFALVSLTAAIGILVWAFVWGGARDRWLSAALGLILGGCLGNLYDRLMFNGVRDFLHWNYLFDWPVFNIADCCLVVGAGMLLLQAFFAPQPQSDNRDKASEEKSQPVSVGGIMKNGTTV